MNTITIEIRQMEDNVEVKVDVDRADMVTENENMVTMLLSNSIQQFIKDFPAFQERFQKTMSQQAEGETVH